MTPILLAVGGLSLFAWGLLLGYVIGVTEGRDYAPSKGGSR